MIVCHTQSSAAALSHPAGRRARAGLSLLEVLTALAIFLFSLVALSRLMNMATDSARDVQWQSKASRLAQSKLNEVIAGVVSINGGDSGNFDEADADWQYSVDSESDATAPNLWKVTIRVWRDRPDGTSVETRLSQYVIDPAQRGGVSQQDSQSQHSFRSSHSKTAPQAHSLVSCWTSSISKSESPMFQS